MATAVTIEVATKIEWLARQTVSGRWVGVCESLNLATEADSLDELHSVINESIQLLMVDLLEDDELSSYLHARGWHASNLPAVHDGDVEFDVPWHLIAEGRLDTERRAH